jgi:hypothetical protein
MQCSLLSAGSYSHLVNSLFRKSTLRGVRASIVLASVAFGSASLQAAPLERTGSAESTFVEISADSYAGDLQARWPEEPTVEPSQTLDRVLLAAADTSASTAGSGKASSANEDNNRLHRALRERDVSVAYGRRVPLDRFDDLTNVELFQVIPRWGRMHNSTMEFLWEVPLMYANEPEKAYGAGLTLMMRQYLSSSRGFNPFVEIGAGVMLTNLDDKIDELGGHFQFSPQAGVGFRSPLSKRGDLVAALRWFHLSNAGMRRPNTGLNNYLLTLGYARWF